MPNYSFQSTIAKSMGLRLHLEALDAVFTKYEVLFVAESDDTLPLRLKAIITDIIQSEIARFIEFNVYAKITTRSALSVAVGLPSALAYKLDALDVLNILKRRYG